MGGDSEMTKAVSGSDVVIDSAADALLRNGWVVLDGLIEPGVLKDLRDEMTLALCGLPHYAYPFGEQRRIPANARRHEFPVTHQVLLHGPLGAICEQYGAKLLSDYLVWSEECKPDPHAIYGRPHFDRRHQLKIFIYLSDVEAKDGPTLVASESRERRERRWSEAWRAALSLDNATDLDKIHHMVSAIPDGTAEYKNVQCEVDVDRPSLTPLTGPAGTVVCFDTSITHCGGLVAGNGHRKTVRRHCILS
jgi:hypothetical protein